MSDGMSRYVARLEHDVGRLESELDTKNKQIEGLLERDKETNYLVQSLHQLLAPILPARHQQRETGRTVDNSSVVTDAAGV
jgi:hypothetical protein